jgi:hypothetical protein
MTEPNATTATTPDPAAEAAAAATAASAAATAAQAAADAEAARLATEREQTVPLSRLQAVVAQRAESERAREALARELKLAKDTLDEFEAVRTRTAQGETAGGTQQPQRTANGTTARAPSPAELQQLVAAEAERLNFAKRCNDTLASGRGAHTDFDKVVLGDLASISPVVDTQTGRPTLPTPLVEAALETGNAHEVLYALGQDVNEASRIMALRPVAQAVELAKFAAKVASKSEETGEESDEAAPTKVSRAPAPIKAPTKGGSARPAFSVEDTDNFSTEEWIRNREKQLAAARASR